MSAPTAQSPPSTDFDGFDPIHPVRKGEPAWDIALLFPYQGNWTEADYLALDTDRPIELSDGCLEFLPMPTPFQQLILQYLFRLLDAFVMSHSLGQVFISPLRVRLWDQKIRLPELVYLKPGRIRDVHQPPEGVDLAMEVVSEGKANEDRDYETKRFEYAKAGIQEYWVVDPYSRAITLFELSGQDYRELGRFGPGSQVQSRLLPGFVVDVTAVFAAGRSASSQK